MPTLSYSLYFFLLVLLLFSFFAYAVAFSVHLYNHVEFFLDSNLYYAALLDASISSTNTLIFQFPFIEMPALVFHVLIPLFIVIVVSLQEIKSTSSKNKRTLLLPPPTPTGNTCNNTEPYGITYVAWLHTFCAQVVWQPLAWCASGSVMDKDVRRALLWRNKVNKLCSIQLTY